MCKARLLLLTHMKEGIEEHEYRWAVEYLNEIKKITSIHKGQVQIRA